MTGAHRQTADCFVDASDELDESSACKQLEDCDAQQDEKGRPPQRAPLRVRLDETTEVLRLALSNEFVKALEICAQR